MKRETRTMIVKRMVGLAAGLALFSAVGVEGAELDCLIEPYLVVNVTAAVEGLLEKVEVERGDLVRKGQVLARLESSVERATVALARARAVMESGVQSNRVRLDYSIRKVASNEDLLKQGGISEREVDEAKAQRDLNEIAIVEARENKRLAELELERAEAALGLRTIQSPVDGVVTARLLSAMELVKEAPIVKLAQLHPLRVEVFVPVSLLGKIAVGATAQVLPEAPIGGSHPARVTVVDRVVDAASGTFGVRLELPNPDYRLPAGLKCKVRFSR
jgi:RND family efflux transporter MFP subunit